MVNKFKSEALISKQAEVTMTKEIKQLEVGYDEQVQELQIELSTWRKQNDILLKQMKEREDKFEDFTKSLKNKSQQKFNN